MQAPQPGQVMVLSKCLLFAVLICLEASAHEKLQVRFEMFCWLFVVIVLVGGRIEGAIDVDAHIYLSLYFH